MYAYIKAMEYVFNICKTKCIGTKYHKQKMLEEEVKVRKAKRDIQEKLATELGIIVNSKVPIDPEQLCEFCYETHKILIDRFIWGISPSLCQLVASAYRILVGGGPGVRQQGHEEILLMPCLARPSENSNH